ncbi:MAG: hypothetical protein JO121_11675 [Deltaproteobacteria bacterium]|nr:hypothetical protein [Deltaproteobacteria bacterium]
MKKKHRYPIATGVTAMKCAFQYRACLGLFLLVLSRLAFAQAPSPLEAGGSNYVFWDIGAYATTPTEAVWYSADGVKPVIGTYHVNPGAIQSQLAQMYAAGQRKLALMLWYAPLGASYAPNYVYGHVVDSSLAQLQPIHQQNLRSLLADIASAGFTQIYFRFAPQGSAMPDSWAAWNEATYQQSWNFIASTISLVSSALAYSNVRIVYDLSVELGGSTARQPQAFEKRLWSDYCTVFDPSKTFGFSVAYQPNRLSQMISDLRATGKIPSMFAIDIYEGTPNVPDLNTVFEDIYLEIGPTSAPIIVEESWESDSNMLAAVTTARTAIQIPFPPATGWLNVVTMMQWPNTPARYFSANPHPGVVAPGYVVDISSELTSGMRAPDVASADYGCQDLNCIWINGVDFDTTSSVSLYDLNRNLLGTYSGGSLTHSANGLQEIITFAIQPSQWNVGNMMDQSGGLYVQVSQREGSSAQVFLPTAKPAISNLGLGCSNNQCIWVNGNNFGADCGAKLYPGNWSSTNPIAVILPGNYGLFCSNTHVTFQIPPAIVQAYRSVNVLVYNTVTSLWSQPVYLAIP